MLWQNFAYKWFSFSDLLAKTQWVVITNVNKNVNTTTNIYNRNNAHGTHSSKTLAGWRLFTFTGQIYDYDHASKEQKWDLLNTVVQVVPTSNDPEFFELSREDKGWNPRRCMAKVFTMPKAENWLNSHIIDVTFELYAENFQIFGASKSASWSLWVYGWNNLWNYLDNQLNAASNTIECTNDGNFAAPCKIMISWPTTDLLVLNTTNGTKLKLNWWTNNLLIDNQNLQNLPNEVLLIEDNGANAYYKWAFWGQILLSPGQNVLSFSDWVLDPSTVITVERYDTYSN